MLNKSRKDVERVCSRKDCNRHFFPNKWNQLYCSKECRFIVNQRIWRIKHKEKKSLMNKEYWKRHHDQQITEG